MQRMARMIFDFYLDASIHVALAISSLLLVSVHLLGITANFHLLGFTFFGTIVCYNFVKYGVEAKKYLIVSNGYHKDIQVFSVPCFFMSLFFLANLKRDVGLAVVLLGAVSTLYAVPLLPKMKNLRSLGGFKIHVVALVWTGFTVFLPVLEAGMPVERDVAVAMLQRFILIVLLMLPFEIRDLKRDDPGLRTIPQILGVERTKVLGIILVPVFFSLSFLKDGLSSLETVSRLFLGTVLISIFTSKQNMQNTYFASFWVEAVPVFWLIAVLVLKSIA